MPPDADLLIRDVRPMGGDGADIRIEAGVIAEIGAGLSAPDGMAVLDGGGALALPGLVNAHAHLDKTRWGLPWSAHAAGPDRDARIKADRDIRRGLIASTEARARALCEHSARLGTSHIRTHVDVEPEFGLAAVEAILALRDKLKGTVDLDLVAFPQFGLVTNPGTAALMEAAVRAGAESVGGIDPAGIDGDRDGQLDAIFAIAERQGAGIDIHLHETGEEGALSLDAICERTRVLGLGGRVAVSHAFCLGTVDDARAGHLIEAMAEAGVGAVTYAPGNMPVPPLKRLRGAGVTMAVGTDGVRDAWTPYGNGDMLERAMMLAYRLGYRADGDLELALDAVIAGGAELLGLERHGLAVGCPADMVLVQAETIAEAVVSRPPERTVLKGGVSVSGASGP
jgi:cytosine deaminase